MYLYVGSGPVHFNGYGPVTQAKSKFTHEQQMKAKHCKAAPLFGIGEQVRILEFKYL